MTPEWLLNSMQTQFDSYDDIARTCNDEQLQAKPDIPAVKSIAEHLWCVVGARESYAKAISAGEWQGFSCSMASFNQEDFVEKMVESAQAVRDAVQGIEAPDVWDDTKRELLLTLHEHEVMHEGQLIRHMASLGYDIPKSVKWY